jgi:hypothetical protein
MINVFFVPGMFGTTLEYVLSNYTYEHTPIFAEICSDGSMHSYKKQAHFTDYTGLSNFVKNKQSYKISTPIYPFRDLHLPEILINFNLNNSDQNLLIHADSLSASELNILFQYYKLSIGAISQAGLDIFSNNKSYDFRKWNPDYVSWKEMQSWQWREWFSLFYPNWVKEWQESVDQVPEYFLKIKNTDLLFDTKNTIDCIIDFCKLTVKPELDEFVQKWQSKQQYIVDEYRLLCRIIDCTITQQPFNWQPISIVAEAIVQQRLRSKGYEIRCDGLNTFPTDSETLYNLLDRESIK